MIVLKSSILLSSNKLGAYLFLEMLLRTLIRQTSAGQLCRIDSIEMSATAKAVDE
jgi:hypothetical protein